VLALDDLRLDDAGDAREDGEGQQVKMKGRWLIAQSPRMRSSKSRQAVASKSPSGGGISRSSRAAAPSNWASSRRGKVKMYFTSSP
jgi:hypothetical protein